LLDSSPGEVAQHFNKIAQLDVIDLGNKNVQSWYRSISQDIELSKVQVESLQDDLEDYAGLDELEKQVAELETLSESVMKLASDEAKIRSSIVEIECTKADLTKLNNLVGINPLVETAIALFKSCKTVADSRFRLKAKVYDGQKLDIALNSFNNILETESTVLITFDLIAKKGLETCSQLELANSINQIAEIKVGIFRTNKNVESLEKEFATKFPSICPLCGKPK
jgi:hypothetical protein